MGTNSPILPYTTLLTNLTSNPKFVAPVPTVGLVSTLTTDVTMYANAEQRILNPKFGTISGLALQAGSPAIDAGTWVSGVHCDRADDGPVPYPANDPNCLHWRGAAPDVGAYEHGIEVVLPSLSDAVPPSTPAGVRMR